MWLVSHLGLWRRSFSLLCFVLGIYELPRELYRKGNSQLVFITIYRPLSVIMAGDPKVGPVGERRERIWANGLRDPENGL
jgi:hypothetical protein